MRSSQDALDSLANTRIITGMTFIVPHWLASPYPDLRFLFTVGYIDKTVCLSAFPVFISNR